MYLRQVRRSQGCRLQHTVQGRSPLISSDMMTAIETSTTYVYQNFSNFHPNAPGGGGVCLQLPGRRGVAAAVQLRPLHRPEPRRQAAAHDQ